MSQIAIHQLYSHKGLPDALQRECSDCGSCEVWVLDCAVFVKCPDGIHDGVHIHFKCGRCGWRVIEYYED